MADEALEPLYFSRRLTETRRAEQLAASIKFDLARSGLSDDELEAVVDEFAANQTRRSGFGVSEVLGELLTREPTRVPIEDLSTLKSNLIARGYLAPGTNPAEPWGPADASAFRRFDRDAYELQKSGRSFGAATVAAGANMLAATLPSRVWQNIVGFAKGFVEQAPETAEDVGLLGGAVAGGAIGTAIAPGVGTLVGGGIGAAVGFFADLISDDPEEEGQSFGRDLIDALSPFEEYSDDPRRFWEDAGWVLSAVSLIGGAKLGIQGVQGVLGATNAARMAPTAAAEASNVANATGAALKGAPWEMASVGPSAVPVAPTIGKALFTPAAATAEAQLGLPGQLTAFVGNRLLPGTSGAIKASLARVSPVAWAERLPALQLVQKGFTGAATASVGIHATAGLGQGTADLNAELAARADAAVKLAAEEGRPLTTEEKALVKKAKEGAGGSTIERAIRETPIPLERSIEGNLDAFTLGDSYLDLAAFMFWPERFAPFAKGTIGNAARVVQGSERRIAPYVEFFMREGGTLRSFREARAAVKEIVTPEVDSWIRMEAGLNQVVNEQILTRRANIPDEELPFVRKALRHQLIKRIKDGDEDVLRDVLSRVEGRSELIQAHLIDTTAPGRSGEAAFKEYSEALDIAVEQGKRIEEMTWLETASGVVRGIFRKPGGKYATDVRLPGGGVMRGGGEGTVPFGKKTVGGIDEIDEVTLRTSAAQMKAEAAKLKRQAGGKVSPSQAEQLLARARRLETDAKALQGQLKGGLKGRKTIPRSLADHKFVVARLDTPTRSTYFELRRQFTQLREAVLQTAKKGLDSQEHQAARADLAQFVTDQKASGVLTEKLAATALDTSHPTTKVSDYLEKLARNAAEEVAVPDGVAAARLEELGYKLVLTGENVLLPGEVKGLNEVKGIGDYSRRSYVFDSLGLRPDVVNDEDIWKLRQATERSEIQQVLESHAIPAQANEVQGKLYNRLSEINHGGQVWGPFVFTANGPKLYRVDIRSLKIEDVKAALDDLPGMTDDVAADLYQALRRGASFGHDLTGRLRHPVEAAAIAGRAMRVNGLAGFSDVVRTWHTADPYKLDRTAWNASQWQYKPASRFARSRPRKDVEKVVLELHGTTKITDPQAQLSMMLFDSMADGAVRAGAYETVDDFFRGFRVEAAREYVARADGLQDVRTLFKQYESDVLPQVKPGTTTKGRITEATTLREASFKRLLGYLSDYDGTPGWYENSAREIARVFGGRKIKVGPVGKAGTKIDLDDFVARVIAVTSGGQTPKPNLTIALKAVKDYIESGGTIRYAEDAPWKPGRARELVNAIFDGGSPETAKFGPFYDALRGDLDAVVQDRRMDFMFGFFKQDKDGKWISASTDGEKAFAREEIRRLAKVSGMRPSVVQEQLWVRFDDYFRDMAAAARRKGNKADAEAFEAIAKGVTDSADFGELLSNPKWAGMAAEIMSLDKGHMGVLFKQFENEIRGSLEFGPDFVPLMKLYQTADFRTLVHEQGHLLRLMMPDAMVSRLMDAAGVSRKGSPHGPWEELEDLALEYSSKHKIPYDPDLTRRYAEVDTDRARRIADAFENGRPTPMDFRTRRAYEKFASETMDQYRLLVSKGYKLIPWGGPGQPYKNAAEFIKDVRENKRIFYFKTLQDDAFGSGAVTEEMIAENPLLKSSGVKVTDSVGNEYEQTYNDIFRAVHDIFGHTKGGFETGARGEENAWRAHAAMYSDEARLAMSTETRGQNSWVNFGPQMRDADGKLLKPGDTGYLRPEERAFSEQKVMLLPDEFSRIDPVPQLDTAQEEAFADMVESYLAGKFKVSNPREGAALEQLKGALGSLWAKMRGRTDVHRDVRTQLDEWFKDAMLFAPQSRTAKAKRAASSSQVVGGAALGGLAGAVEGAEDGVFDEDILQGALRGAVGGVVLRKALGKTYGHLPDAMTRLNTALRYTLSFTFDAGRYMEQNTIAMAKYGLPPMFSPKSHLKTREWKSPYSITKVTGDEAWDHAVRFWDELNGTTWFHNIDDIDRRMYQAGLLGFQPRNWEAAQAWQLYQRGMKTEQIKEAISNIGRYGVGRAAAEKSANFVFFPFSFSKKYLTTLGDFVLQAPGRNLLVTEGLRRYHESSLDEGFNEFVEKHAPLLKELWRVNNLAFGISPGRFFLEGLGDDRTASARVAHTLASFFVPSGAVTPLSTAVGQATDYAINGFVPVVLTGESIDRVGGIDNMYDIVSRYIPFTRELGDYWEAGAEQITAITEGAAPFYQYQKYVEGQRDAKDQYGPMASALGYSSVDGFLGSDIGAGFKGTVDAQQRELQRRYPTGFELSTQFENEAAQTEAMMMELIEKPAPTDAERAILSLREAELFYKQLEQVGMQREVVDAMALQAIRELATKYVGDRRFNELYRLFFERTYGPIRRVA